MASMPFDYVEEKLKIQKNNESADSTTSNPRGSMRRLVQLGHMIGRSIEMHEQMADVGEVDIYGGDGRSQPSGALLSGEQQWDPDSDTEMLEECSNGVEFEVSLGADVSTWERSCCGVKLDSVAKRSDSDGKSVDDGPSSATRMPVPISEQERIAVSESRQNKD